MLFVLILALVFCFAGTIVDECHDGCRLDVPLALQPLVKPLCMGKMYIYDEFATVTTTV